MKTTRRTAFVCLVLGIVFSACSPETVAPNDNPQSPTIALSNPHDLGPMCYEPSIFAMKDGNGNISTPGYNPYGKLIVSYNLDQTFMTLDLGAGWFVTKAAWYFGNSSNCPLTQNGLLNPIAFPESESLNPLLASHTFVSNFVDDEPNCYEAVFWAEVVQLNFFSGPVPGTNVDIYAAQAPLANGHMIEMCYNYCQIERAE